MLIHTESMEILCPAFSICLTFYKCGYMCIYTPLYMFWMNTYLYIYLRMELLSFTSWPSITPTSHQDMFVVLQVLFTGNQQEEKQVEMTEEGQEEPAERGFPRTLLRGTFSEEESAQSFQDALRQWRGDKKGAGGEPLCEDAMWTPVRPGKLWGNSAHHPSSWIRLPSWCCCTFMNKTEATNNFLVTQNKHIY